MAIGEIQIHWRTSYQTNPGCPVGEEEYGHAGSYGDFKRTTLDWERTPIAGETIHLPTTSGGTHAFVVREVEWRVDGSPLLVLETYVEYLDGKDEASRGEEDLRAAGFIAASESYGEGVTFI